MRTLGSTTVALGRRLCDVPQRLQCQARFRLTLQSLWDIAKSYLANEGRSCCVQIPLPKGSTATVHLMLRVSSASQPTKSLSTPPLTTTLTSPLTHRTFRLHGVLAIPLSQSLPGSPEMMAVNDESSEDEFATPPHQQAMTDQVTSYRHTIRATPCPEATCCVIFVALSRARVSRVTAVLAW